MIYEVNLKVDAEIIDQYMPWMHRHLEEMVEIPGFSAASLFERRPEEEDEPGEGVVLLTAHYVVEDEAAMQAYLEGPASRMRQDGIDRFGGRFTATRRFLYPVR